MTRRPTSRDAARDPSSWAPGALSGWFALALCALLLFAQAWQCGHRATTGHALCDEHGVWEHVDLEGGIATAEAHGQHFAPSSSPEGGVLGGHEHCVLASVLGSRAVELDVEPALGDGPAESGRRAVLEPARRWASASRGRRAARAPPRLG